MASFPPEAYSPAQGEQRIINCAPAGVIRGEQRLSWISEPGLVGEQTASANGVSSQGKKGEQRRQVIPLPILSPRVPPRVSKEAEPETSAPENEVVDAQGLQWIKAQLPEPTNGWWDVRSKGAGVVIKFRWRGQSIQTLTLLRISGEEYRSLRKISNEEAERILHERLVAHLHNISADPQKREKVLLAAQKLRIGLESAGESGIGD